MGTNWDQLYSERNAAGDGYEAPCATVDESMEFLCTQPLHAPIRERQNQCVAVVRDESSGRYILIGGDARGREAWCVDVNASEVQS